MSRYLSILLFYHTFPWLNFICITSFFLITLSNLVQLLLVHDPFDTFEEIFSSISLHDKISHLKFLWMPWEMNYLLLYCFMRFYYDPPLRNIINIHNHTRTKSKIYFHSLISKLVSEFPLVVYYQFSSHFFFFCKISFLWEMATYNQIIFAEPQFLNKVLNRLIFKAWKIVTAGIFTPSSRFCF